MRRCVNVRTRGQDGAAIAGCARGVRGRYRAADADVDVGRPCTLTRAHTRAHAQRAQLVAVSALLSHLDATRARACSGVNTCAQPRMQALTKTRSSLSPCGGWAGSGRVTHAPRSRAPRAPSASPRSRGLTKRAAQADLPHPVRAHPCGAHACVRARKQGHMPVRTSASTLAGHPPYMPAHTRYACMHACMHLACQYLRSPRRDTRESAPRTGFRPRPHCRRRWTLAGRSSPLCVLTVSRADASGSK